MRHHWLIMAVFLILSLALLFQSGCQEQAKAPKAEDVPLDGQLAPMITFEKVVHDFGEVVTGKKYFGEFKFTNTGESLLRITGVEGCCGIVAKLAKKEFAPGENGVLKIEYSSAQNASVMRRQIHVKTNNKTNPKVTLTIKAEIVIKVAYEPQRIKLVLNDENAGCPKIMIRSLDKQSFSITTFQSTGQAITADVDSSVEATKFVLEPKVDLEKLQNRSSGLVTISLKHPEHDKVNILYRTKQRFELKPSSVMLLNPRSDEPSINKVSIVNSYGEEFEIESTSSEKGMAKVINQREIKGGYRLEVEITPPAPNHESHSFEDMVNVNLKGGETLKIKCYVRYLSKEEN